MDTEETDYDTHVETEASIFNDDSAYNDDQVTKNLAEHTENPNEVDDLYSHTKAGFQPEIKEEESLEDLVPTNNAEYDYPNSIVTSENSNGQDQITNNIENNYSSPSATTENLDNQIDYTENDDQNPIVESERLESLEPPSDRKKVKTEERWLTNRKYEATYAIFAIMLLLSMLGYGIYKTGMFDISTSRLHLEAVDDSTSKIWTEKIVVIFSKNFLKIF